MEGNQTSAVQSKAATHYTALQPSTEDCKPQCRKRGQTHQSRRLNASGAVLQPLSKKEKAQSKEGFRNDGRRV